MVSSMKRKTFLTLLALIICFLLVFLNLNINKKDGFNSSLNFDYEQVISKIRDSFEQAEKNREKKMSLVAVGDALIHGSVFQDAYIGNNNYDFSKMFTYIEPLIKDYDLKYYNQETIIGGKNLGVSHYPRFNSPDEIALNLIDIGFNMVSLANNHSLDKNEEGILYSVNFWKEQPVIVSGQSDSFEDRNNIKIYRTNGIKYAFIAYTDGTNGLSLPEGKEYLVNVYSDEQAKIDIESIKDKVDVIIVSMHWGNEYTFVPTQKQREEAEYLSSLGVNLIIGSHPHVIQPVEYVGNTLVIYSLGNFISGQLPLGIDKVIGLMVGVDIVVKNGEVSFRNIDYKLLYTYSTVYNTNYKVIPFENLTDDILPNYKSIEEQYMNIVTGGD